MKTLLYKLRNFKGANIILFIIFASTIYLQCCFFHSELGFSWDPLLVHTEFFKVSIAILIASFVFLFKHKSWIIWVSAFINIWGISNLTYYRSSHILIDAYSVTMIGNMDGFWDSVPFFMKLSDYYVLYTTLIVILAYILFKNNNRNISLGIIAIIISIGLHITGYEKRVRLYKYDYFIKNKVYNPFSLGNSTFGCWDLYDKIFYTKETSIIHHFIYQSHYFCGNILFKSTYQLTDIEENNIKNYINTGHTTPKPNRPVFIILIESFENWVLTPTSMPNLYEFINNNNVLYSPKIITQTRGGASSDGQMIVNTGLLPTKEGAVCFRFPDNTFPAISKLYDKTFNIIPGGQSVWNQLHMNKAYKINDNIDANNDDKLLVEQFMSMYKNYDYGMLLTMSTHSPFSSFAHLSSLSLPDDMPKYMSNYIKSFNYTDKCIKPILEAIKTDEYLKNSVVVITGDHNIHSHSKREEYYKFCTEQNMNYAVMEEYCPLIIYSPDFTESKVIHDIVYQMDIFPTILSAIGCETYYWKGFGLDLLKNDLIPNRQNEMENTLNLSDKLHQANYFKNIDGE